MPSLKHRKNQYLNKLLKSSFIKNILIVMSGTGAAQIISFALIPIISRLFSPSDFGVFGSFEAIVMVIAAGVTLDYSQAIMLPKERGEAINLFVLSCLSVIIICSCITIIWLFAPGFLQNLLKFPNKWISGLLIIAVLFKGLNITFQAWCVRIKSFKTTSSSQVIRSLSSKGTQIGLGYLNSGPLALVVGTVIGDALAILNLARVQLRDLSKLRRYIGWARMRQLAGEYRDFPMYSATQNVMNSLSQGLPVLLLTHYYGVDIAGAYAFARRVISTPMSFVLASLRQVLFQKASEAHQSGIRLFPLFLQITIGLFALALIPSVILLIWSPQLFSWIFGSQWYTAGEFTRSLVLWLAFAFCNLPAVLFAKIIRIQRFVFFYDLVLLIVRSLTLVLSSIYMSALHTVMLFSLVGAIMNAIFILWVGYSVRKKEYHKREQ